VSVTFEQLSMSGTLTVRDIWHKADVAGLTTGISAEPAQLSLALRDRRLRLTNSSS
jgi:hypothetical protein